MLIDRAVTSSKTNRSRPNAKWCKIANHPHATMLELLEQPQDVLPSPEPESQRLLRAIKKRVAPPRMPTRITSCSDELGFFITRRVSFEVSLFDPFEAECSAICLGLVHGFEPSMGAPFHGFLGPRRAGLGKLPRLCPGRQTRNFKTRERGIHRRVPCDFFIAARVRCGYSPSDAAIKS
ncbi:hypothetical protein Pla52o_40980 [Novipirellula galeiformis]|uniref:Uncharacterized protein n=1 Tax=Novipirellula galeiformis TaxID=2528004 RepID=A0A5C6CCC5_9BACT|nr:hypothetical protein Pla52o_40980 [Novipirellula galeiformis]